MPLTLLALVSSPAPQTPCPSTACGPAPWHHRVLAAANTQPLLRVDPASRPASFTGSFYGLRINESTKDSFLVSVVSIYLKTVHLEEEI